MLFDFIQRFFLINPTLGFFVGGGGGALRFPITNSARLRANASPYLSRTFGAPTNNKIYTISAWLKHTDLAKVFQVLFSCPTAGFLSIGDATNANVIRFNDGVNTNLITSEVKRDPAGHFHLTIGVDTTQATAANRVKIFLNDLQVTAFSSANYPALNDAQNWNSAGTHNIGRRVSTANAHLDSILSEFHFVDGQQLANTSFAQYDINGAWVSKPYSGIYGNNGFHLDFKDAALTSGSNVGLGKDVSGNGNYWNTNNISVAAGTSYDALIDTPTNNWCTLNPLKKASSITLTETALRASCSANAAGVHGTQLITRPTYFEMMWISGGRPCPGVATPQGDNTTLSGDATTDATLWEFFAYNGNKMNGSNVAYGSAAAAGDIIGVAVDPPNGKIWFSINGTWQASGDPAAGTNAAFTNIPATGVIPCVSSQLSGWDVALNFGQAPLNASATWYAAAGGYFKHAPPAGFTASCTANMPAVAIPNARKHHDIVTRAGTGTGFTKTGLLFQPDWWWGKCRSSASYGHRLVDAVRGVTKALLSHSTSAELTDATGLTAFTGDGYTLGAALDYNNSGDTFVDWLWKANGAGSANTDGSITSTVSANQVAGFSIAEYQGNGNISTVGHGLGAAPKMIIFKGRNTTTPWGWFVYHAGLTSAAYRLELQSAAGQTNGGSPGQFNSTAPNSTVFSIGNSVFPEVNESGKDYVACSIADVSGYSKAFSYTGNGSADGPFVYLGFRPRWVLIKNASTANGWLLLDTARSPYNTANSLLNTNTANAESSGYPFDFLSNGFKIRDSSAGWNASNDNIVGFAFAEHPFGGSNIAPSPAR